MPRFLLPLALLPEGWASHVLVEADAAGMITAVTPSADPAQHRDAERLDGPVLPGLPNLHSHAFQRAMIGRTERAGHDADSFWTWRETMYRFAHALTPEDLEAIAAELYGEMLARGYTAVAEFHYLHHQPDGSPYLDPAEMSRRILAAADATGIALTHLPVLYRHGGFNDAAPQPRQRRFLHDADGYAALLQRLAPDLRGRGDRRLGIAPHSLRAVSPALLKAGLEAIDGIDETTPVHIHIAEQIAEVTDCLAARGARPVAWLLDNAPVDARWCLVHATHVNAEETRRLAASGAVAGLCPSTEANLGDGLFPAAEYLAAGGRFGIGSDSHACVDPAEELRLLEYGQRLVRHARNVLAAGPGGSTGRRLFDAACRGGAQALGLPMGAIAPSMRCDLVVLDAEAPALAERQGDDLLDAWIFSGPTVPPKAVYAAGKRVAEHGRHKDAAERNSRCRAALRRLAQEF